MFKFKKDTKNTIENVFWMDSYHIACKLNKYYVTYVYTVADRYKHVANY